MPYSPTTLLSQAVRSHWQVENRLHWVLDIAFLEDACRIRKDYAPENLAVVRDIALYLLSQETTLKVGVKNKRLQAGWDEDYLLPEFPATLKIFSSPSCCPSCLAS
jgi:hypothetical protein